MSYRICKVTLDNVTKYRGVRNCLRFTVLKLINMLSNEPNNMKIHCELSELQNFKIFVKN